MNFTISTLCKKGKKLPPDKVAKTVTGNLTTYYIGSTIYAQVSDKSGCHLLPQLECASMDVISLHGMLLSGYEIGNRGNRSVQEWWCKPVNEETAQ